MRMRQSDLVYNLLNNISTRGKVKCKDTFGRTVPAYNNYIGHKSNRIVTIMVNLSSLTEKKILITILKEVLLLVMYLMVLHLLSGVDLEICFQVKSQVRSLL